MNQATGSATPDNRHELRFSNGNWIAFVVLMLGGWYAGLDDSDRDVPIEAFYSERPIIERITDQQIDLADAGIAITPTDGWTYLKVTDKKANRSLNFVNEKQFLIAAIKPVNFREWPPTFQSKKGGDDTDDPPKRIAQEIDAVQYSQIVVEWYSLQHLPYATYHDGRIDTDRQEFIIRIMSQRGYTDEQMAAVTRLCDQISRIP